GFGEATLTASPEASDKRPEDLVRENIGWVRGWLRGRVKDPDLADDLCQESFLRALRRFSRLRDPAKAAGWLYRIAENTLRDHLRNESRRKKRVVFTDQLEEMETPAAPSEDPLGQAEATGKLLEMVQALPPKLREPLLLRHSRSLPYREIGRILGISEKAVQVRIFRARQLLRSKQTKLTG